MSAPLSCGGIFDLSGKRTRIEELERAVSDPALWEDREQAEGILREKRQLERELAFFDETDRMLSDASVMLELATEERDPNAIEEASAGVRELAERIEEAEIRRLLHGEHDQNSAIVSINAGAGGTDSCDWAEMLLRMYLRWSEESGFRAEILDIQAGEEAASRASRSP